MNYNKKHTKIIFDIEFLRKLWKYKCDDVVKKSRGVHHFKCAFESVSLNKKVKQHCNYVIIFYLQDWTYYNTLPN